jgi:hypothetical protein
MNYKAGTTVLAIRDGEDNTLNVYGEGVYVGDLPRPGSEGEIPDEDYQAITKVITTDDATPADKHPLVEFAVAMAQLNGLDPEEVRTASVTNIEEERARPVHDRAVELYREVNQNPCIYLDSGDIVWGFQCWWGPLDQAKQRFAGCELVTVPVPEDNERWK